MHALDHLHALQLMQQPGATDIIAILQDRWMFMIPVIVVLVIYAVTMDFRRFIAIVGGLTLFQLMWESIHASGVGFPFFSLQYTVPSNIDFYILSFPASAVLFKSIIPLSGSYILASMATKTMVDSKMDMVKDRGKKVLPHMASRVLASGMHVVMLIAIEPILANGETWLLGPYETFGNAVYFGVDPAYFLGSFLTAAISCLTVGVLEARIGYDEDEVFFDFENKRQASTRYQLAGFMIVIITLLISSCIALFIDVVMGMIDLVVVIPLLFILHVMLVKFSDARERANIGDFCKDNPGSFICDYDRR